MRHEPPRTPVPNLHLPGPNRRTTRDPNGRTGAQTVRPLKLFLFYALFPFFLGATAAIIGLMLRGDP